MVAEQKFLKKTLLPINKVSLLAMSFHTIPSTTNIWHFFVESLFIYLRKRGLMVLILIFQNFNSRGIGM
jgi:hypothetical protein